MSESDHTNRAEERLAHALELAFRFLNKRDRTVAEVVARLEAAEVDADSVARAVETLVGEGYLDDARYAQRFAEDRRALDGWGSSRITRRLSSLGIDRDLVQAAVVRHDDGEERDAALAVLRRRFSTPPQDARGRDRMLGVLLRKGYEPELAHDALRAFSRQLAVE